MRTKEQGSVVGYVLGAVLLLALLLGGIVLYKNYAGNLDKAPVVGQNTGDDKPANESGNSQSSQDEAELKRQQEEAERKAKEQSEAAKGNGTNSNSTQNTDTKKDDSAQNKVAQVPHTSTAPGELPTTGPAEDAMLIALGISTITGAVIAYRRSAAAL